MADHPQDKPNPPCPESFAGKQLSLFQQFLCNSAEERANLSNAIDFWDLVPKYCISRKEMAKLRKQGGFLPTSERQFEYHGKAFVVRVRPGRVKDTNGAEIEFYPSAREELVEDALRKIATDQDCGFYNLAPARSGVVFSLHMLRQELAHRGHTSSYQQVVEALTILADASIEILAADGRSLVKSPILPSLAAVSKKQLADDPHARWYADFSPMVTESIRALKYRQFDYNTMMQHSSQLTRWLHKRLAANYTNASHTVPYTIFFSTIQRDSGLLDLNQKRDAIRKLDEAWSELQARGVITAAKKEDSRGPRGVLKDAKYTVQPSARFIAQVKAANKRVGDGRAVLGLS